MSTQSIIQQVRWQDLKVRSEVDVVLEIAKEKGWEDCEIFGHGNMITQPRESTGWKLIPADLYEESIPAEGVVRIRQILEAGVRIQGIIIADDQRRIEAPPAPSKPKVLPSIVKKIQSFFGRVLTGLRRVPAGFGQAFAILSLVPAWLGRALARLSRVPAELGRALTAGLGRLLVGIGKVLIKLISIAGVIALITLPVYLLIRFPQIIFVFGFLAFVRAVTTTSPNTSISYDPKLVVLVDEGQGGTVWVSVLTWYD